MTNKFYTVVLSSEEFGDKLYEEVGNLLRVLFKAGYICVVKEELEGIVRIDYNYDEFNNYGNALPIWLDQEEMEILDYCLETLASDTCEVEHTPADDWTAEIIDCLRDFYDKE